MRLPPESVNKPVSLLPGVCLIGPPQVLGSGRLGLRQHPLLGRGLRGEGLATFASQGTNASPLPCLKSWLAAGCPPPPLTHRERLGQVLFSGGTPGLGAGHAGQCPVPLPGLPGAPLCSPQGPCGSYPLSSLPPLPLDQGVMAGRLQWCPEQPWWEGMPAPPTLRARKARGCAVLPATKPTEQEPPGLQGQRGPLPSAPCAARSTVSLRAGWLNPLLLLLPRGMGRLLLGLGGAGQGRLPPAPWPGCLISPPRPQCWSR